MFPALFWGRFVPDDALSLEARNPHRRGRGMDEASIFLEALKKPLPDERAAFLDQACGGNAELRRSVELLLRAHDKAGGFLADSPGPLGVTVDQPVPEGPGTAIGPYKLIEQ